MLKKISSKSIFASLILFILASFFVNFFIPKDVNFSNTPQNNNEILGKTKMILDAKIYKENKNGEKFIITAETLKESETEDKRTELKNSITTINKNGILTKIYAGFAIISNEYDDFSLSEKVKIIKKSRNFVLKTDNLKGNLNKGNFFTNEKVAITAGNINISGEGLDLKNNGEYIKVKGKAKLIMLLSKNDY